MNKYMDKFTEVCAKIADNRYVSAISKGIMALVPFTMVSAIFTIIATPPVTAELLESNGFLNTVFGGWYAWATEYKTAISLPATMINGLFAVIANYGIAYNLASHYKQNAKNSAIMSVIAFIMVAAPISDGVLSVSYLGTAGLFLGIIGAIAAIEIIHLCESKNIVIRLPKAVPPVVASSFSAIIPLLLMIVIFYGLHLICMNTLGMALPAVIMNILTPAVETVNTPFMVILISIFALLLWCLGIHGTSISWALLGPMLMAAVASNGDLVASGQMAVFSPVLLYTFVSSGGTGQSMSLTILCARSKSKQLNAVGKVSLIPNFFGITEPIQFGAPIIYNPLLIIPFILSPVVNMLLGWFVLSTGIVPLPYIGLWSLMPVGIGELLRSMSIRSFIFSWVQVGVGAVIYYPFFKMYEKQLVEKELAAEAEQA